MPATFTVETWPLSRIIPYPGNPRKITDKAVAVVAASLREYGWQQPIVVDEEGVILAGHTRLLGARSNGWRRAPVKIETGFTPEQKLGYRLMDNRSGEEAEWDDPKVAAELRLLEELGVTDLEAMTGFNSEEISRLMFEVKVTPEAADEAEVGPAPKRPRTKKGDRILLGAHVLLCGDATDPIAWDRLLEGERPHALFTDPPYGVDYVGGTKEKLTIENDGTDIPALTALLRSSLGLARQRVAPGGAWFVCGPHGPPFVAFAIVHSELGVWRQTLCWVKDRFVLSRQDFHWQQEVILAGVTPPDAPDDDLAAEEFREFSCIAYGWVPGEAHSWLGDRKQSTVIECPRPSSSREHPTMKPVQLIDPLLQLTVPAGGMVVDCFAGSGSTLMACETSGRVARCMELDPKYCDVIVTRWEEATGEQAVRP